MSLTKTDFIQYLQCPEGLWLKKNRPDEYPKPEPSLFLERLGEEGYEIEAYAKALFDDPIDLPEFVSTERTQQALAQGGKVFCSPRLKQVQGFLHALMF